MGQQFIDEAIGWAGMALIVIAYALSSFGILAASTILSIMLNIAGSLGIIYISFKKRAYQPGVLNIIWIIIALVALIKLLI